MSSNRTVDVVTGGAGFIGSTLARALLAAGRRVRIVDDLSTGYRRNLPEGAEFIEGDAAMLADRAVRDADVVYHLAAIPSVPRSIKQPLETHHATVETTVALLQAATREGVRRLVLASSSSVYGNTPTLPKHELMPPDPLSPYAAAKLTAELHARCWAGVAPLETVSLRFFNVYGPRQDPKSAYAAVVPIFSRCLQEGRSLPICGDGRQTRDFTFVGDVVRGIIAAGTAPGVSGRVYNVAGGRPVSVLDLAGTLSRLAGQPPRLDFLPARAGDIRDSWADISAAQRDLKFEATTSIEDGLRATWEAFSC